MRKLIIAFIAFTALFSEKMKKIKRKLDIVLKRAIILKVA